MMMPSIVSTERSLLAFSEERARRIFSRKCNLSPSFLLSDTIFPSLIVSILSVSEASSGLWVMRMMVFLSSLWSLWKMSITMRPVFVSRAPVGSSARIIDGVFSEGSCYSYTLFLTA